MDKESQLIWEGRIIPQEHKHRIKLAREKYGGWVPYDLDQSRSDNIDNLINRLEDKKTHYKEGIDYHIIDPQELDNKPIRVMLSRDLSDQVTDVFYRRVESFDATLTSNLWYATEGTPTEDDEDIEFYTHVKMDPYYDPDADLIDPGEFFNESLYRGRSLYTKEGEYKSPGEARRDLYYARVKLFNAVEKHVSLLKFSVDVPQEWIYYPIRTAEWLDFRDIVDKDIKRLLAEESIETIKKAILAENLYGKEYVSQSTDLFNKSGIPVSKITSKTTVSRRNEQIKNQVLRSNKTYQEPTKKGRVGRWGETRNAAVPLKNKWTDKIASHTGGKHKDGFYLDDLWGQIKWRDPMEIFMPGGNKVKMTDEPYEPPRRSQWP